ncbi:MAG: glycogen/starch/alpha-glucan phosphorylase [Geminicoccaceae bacterium]
MPSRSHDDIRRNPDIERPRVVKLIAGKAAPSYRRAKLIIKLANDVGKAIREDPAIGGRLELVFLPNYNVSLAERMIPAADLPEQISTAGMEASGTGNMKLALTSAVTIGTLDGANVEMLERVGEDGMLIFGLDAAEVLDLRQSGWTPSDPIDRSPCRARALDLLESGHFSKDDPAASASIVDDLRRFDISSSPPISTATARPRPGHTAFSPTATGGGRPPPAPPRMGWFSSGSHHQVAMPRTSGGYNRNRHTPPCPGRPRSRRLTGLEGPGWQRPVPRGSRGSVADRPRGVGPLGGRIGTSTLG